VADLIDEETEYTHNMSQTLGKMNEDASKSPLLLFNDIDDINRNDTVYPTQFLLMLYCLGNKSNTELLMRAFPASMMHILNLSIDNIKKLRLSATPFLSSKREALMSAFQNPFQIVNSVLLMQREASSSIQKRSMTSFFSKTPSSASIATEFSIFSLLNSFASKMSDNSNWIVLFDIIGCHVSTPQYEWNKTMVIHLQACVNAAVENLDFSRRIRYLKFN
jgi:hypothetical protein